MNRREFLIAAGAVAASAALHEASETRAAEAPSAAATTAQPKTSQLAAPPPGVDYFTQERLAKAINISPSLEGIDFTAVTFVCNLWHPSPVLEQWFGKGFSEWEICRRAKRMYDEHYQPKRPSWGYYKEAEVEWATRE